MCEGGRSSNLIYVAVAYMGNHHVHMFVHFSQRAGRKLCRHERRALAKVESLFWVPKRYLSIN